MRDQFEVRCLGEVPVRGKVVPVKIYTVLGPALAREDPPKSPGAHDPLPLDDLGISRPAVRQG